MRIIRFFILLVILSTGISASLCQEITDIIVRTDLELADRSELNHALKPYIGRSIEVNVLKELLESVNAVYHDFGYAGARAYFPEQDCTSGAIEVGVMPAEIDSVIIAAATDNQYIRDGAVSRLLGKYQEYAGKRVDTRYLATELLKLHDHGSFDVKARFTPVKDPSKLLMTVILKSKKPVSAGAFYDNFGNKTTGKNRLSAYVRAPSLTGNGDKAFFMVTGTNKQSYSLSADYQFPVNAEPLCLGLSTSYGLYDLSDKYSDLSAKGNQLALELYATMPLVRTLNSRLFLKGRGFYRLLEDEIKDFDVKMKRSNQGVGLDLMLENELSKDLISSSKFSLVYAKSTNKDDLEIVDEKGYFYSLIENSLEYRMLDNFRINNSFNLQLAGKSVDAADRFIPCGAYAVSAYESDTASSQSGVFDRLKLSYDFIKSDKSLVGYTSLMQAYAFNSSGESEKFFGINIGADFAFGGFTADISLNKAIGANRHYAADDVRFMIQFGYSME